MPKVKIHRVSRWFAIGFKSGKDGQPKSMLNEMKVDNDWQRSELDAGWEKAQLKDLLPQVQFWYVEGYPVSYDAVKQTVYQNIGDNNE